MSHGGYKITNQSAIHFVTFTVVEWVNVFTRQEYRQTIFESLHHCQEYRGLIVHGWCLMSNHLHLLLRSKENDLSAIIRDFKKFTSRQLIKQIGEYDGESRKSWMLPIFKTAGEENSQNMSWQFWIQCSQPKECFGEKFTRQKLDYIHNNPVEAGIVYDATEYVNCSARDYLKGKQVGPIKIDLLW